MGFCAVSRVGVTAAFDRGFLLDDSLFHVADSFTNGICTFPDAPLRYQRKMKGREEETLNFHKIFSRASTVYTVHNIYAQENQKVKRNFWVRMYKLEAACPQ